MAHHIAMVSRSASTACAWRLAALLLFALVGAPSSLSAQTSAGVADEADTQFRLGAEAYRAQDFERALAHYFMSNRLAPNRNVVFNIGRCYEKLGRFVEAYRYYTYYAADETDESKRADVAEALQRVSRNVSLLEVASDPPGATLYIDRKDLGAYGVTPQTLALPPGTYTVILERDGFIPSTDQVATTQVGETAHVAVTLARILGAVRLAGSPAGAGVVAFDPAGEVTGTLPADLPLSPGERRLQVSAPGHVTQEITVHVEANAVTEATVDLARETGTLVVQAEERDALITIDGQAEGFTPAVIDDLPSGKHVLTVLSEGFRPYVREVTIEANARTLVDVTLEIADDVAAASRTVESVQSAPASVTLLGRRELDAFGYNTVSDAVLGVRGLYPNDDLTYASYGVRGFNPFGQYGNHILTLLDGHTLNDDWIGASYQGYDLLSDLHMIEQIEVVRGPGSVLYGTGAFFGVTNLVTVSQVSEPRVTAGLSAIDRGGVRAYGDAAAPLGEDGGVWVAGGGLEVQGQDYASTAFLGSPAAPDGVARDVGGFDAATAMTRAWKGPWTVQGYFNQRDKQIPTAAFGTLYGDDRTRTFDRRAFAEVRFEPSFGEGARLMTRAFYDYYGYEGFYAYAPEDGGSFVERYDGGWLGTEARAVLRPWSSARVAAGAEYQYHLSNRARGFATETPDQLDLDEEHPYHQISAYANADLTLASWFALSAGARLDAWFLSDLVEDVDLNARKDVFLYSANPRLAGIFQTGAGTTVKLLGGRAFRAPSIYELTYNDGGFTQVPAPDLVPEVIYTGELEVSQRLPGAFWATGAVFFSHVSDLIDMEGSGDSADPLRFVNLDAAVVTLGAEAELRREFRQGWMLSAQYSYQRTRLSELVDGEQIPNSPEHMAAVKVVAPIYSHLVRLATRASADFGRLDRNLEPSDPAVVWDLALSGEVPVLSLHYSLGVRNLLDWRYRQPVGDDVLEVTVPQAGRSFVVDLRLTF